MSLAGTNLPNELPLRAHHSHVRSRCAAARTSVDLPGSWPRFTSEFWRCSLPMNRACQECSERQGFLRAEYFATKRLNNTTPSPQSLWAALKRKLGPPPTRPTHQTEKANLPNGNTLAGVTKQSYCRVPEPIFPTGIYAPKGHAATLHATATELESLRFMGPIKHSPRRFRLSMNRTADGPRPQRVHG